MHWECILSVSFLFHVYHFHDDNQLQSVNDNIDGAVEHEHEVVYSWKFIRPVRPEFDSSKFHHLGRKECKSTGLKNNATIYLKSFKYIENESWAVRDEENDDNWEKHCSHGWVSALMSGDSIVNTVCPGIRNNKSEGREIDTDLTTMRYMRMLRTMRTTIGRKLMTKMLPN